MTEQLATPAPRTKLTLVVCTLNRSSSVQRLVEATLRCARVPDEILLVDASDEQEARATKEFLDRLSASSSSGALAVRLGQILVDAKDRGLTKQRNAGIRASTGEFIAFLDDDCVPESEYFRELETALESHPQAVGVGGWLDEEQWQVVGAGSSLVDTPSLEPRERSKQQPDTVVFDDGWIVHSGWRRREGARWRLRRTLGLAPAFLPGVVPPEGHGWPVAYQPPNADVVAVDCFMGGASLWRRSLFERIGFDPWFEGYGLYEDLDFCIRAATFGSLWLVPAAKVAHLHEASSRPRHTKYGRMVVVNGWRVWRTANPDPALSDRLRWWLVTLLLLLVRATNVLSPGGRWSAARETFGRLRGVLSVMTRPPDLESRPLPPLSPGESSVEENS